MAERLIEQRGRDQEHADVTWGFLAQLRRLMQAYGALWDTKVGTATTPPQFGVLAALAREPGLDQKTLGERISTDRSTTADIVGRLRKRELIVRLNDPEDSRRNVLILSDTGRMVLEGTSTLVEAMRHEVFAEFAEDERTEFFRLVNKLLASIQTAQEQQPS